MSESLVHVDIDLLRRHPELPDAAEILQNFAEHHAQSEARQRSHDELMRSDSNLDLEDFGSLAASALESHESHDSVLGEESPEFTESNADLTDTLPEQEAAPTSDDADEHEPDDALVEASEEVMTAEDVSHEDDADTSAAEAAKDSPEENAPDEEQVEASEANAAPTEEASAAKKTTAKKRTRKRKKKKS